MEFGLVALWLATYLLLLLVGMPVTRALVPRLADRGAGIALPVALSVVWLVAYAVGFVSITAGLWLGVAVLAVLAVASQRRGYELDGSRYAETAVVFSVAFLFVIAFRAFDPAASAPAGEKFLDMGLLQSLLRGSTIPPEDVWFAGESVRYYYGGHYLASLLARMTGTEARFAYNPALAGFYAMLVTGVYGLAGSIAADRGFPRVPAAVAGAFFVGFASNLHTPVQVVLGLFPDSVVEPVASALGVDLTGAAESLAEFSYWPASRVIETTINEFPLFAWLNGDLHAHMMSPMVLVVVVGVLADVWMGGEDRSRRRTLVSLFGVVPALAGVIAVFNSWSFPAVGGLVAVTVWLGPVSPAALLSDRLAARERGRGPLGRELSRIGLAAGSGALALALGFCWSLPYWLWTASSESSVGVLPTRSALGPLLVVHGAFLLLFWLFAYRHAGRPLERLERWGLAGGAVGLLAISTALDAPAVGLFGPLIALGWFLLRWWAPSDSLFEDAEDAPVSESAPASDGGRDGPGFETVLVVAVAGLVLAVEFVHVAEPLAPERFNTVFKAYAQVWVLAAIAAGVVLVRLLIERAPELSLSGPRWRYAFAGLAVALLLSTSLYGVLALSDHVQSDAHRSTDELTLDALAYVEEEHPEEAPAIEYLLYEVEGQPNMVSFPNDGTYGYSWANAPASMTGVPTLAGWWPSRGYHGSERYDQRVADAETIYTGDPADQRYLLDWYDIELIYLGPHEREQYGAITVEELDAVSVEKQWGSVVLYRVDQSELDAVEN